MKNQTANSIAGNEPCYVKISGRSGSRTWKMLAVVLLLASCVKNEKNEDIVENQSPKYEAGKALSDCTSGCWIGTSNQATKELELYSYYASDWDAASARTWNWKPTLGRGYVQAEVDKWGNPNDFKIREVPSWGGNYVAAIGNGGLVTIANYSTGNKRWAVSVGGSSVDNIHGVELLPNGNIAIAASEGGYVRIWGSSSGGTTPSNYALEDAHAVLWDPAYNVLWAFGRKKLVALKVGSSASSPALTASATYILPSDDYGHAIGAKYGNVNQLYVASSNKVWIFDKVAGTFTEAPGLINRNAVKAISNQPDGVVVLTRPDNVKSPVPSEPSTLYNWTTSYVDYYSASGTYISSGHRNGASYYKGFVYNTLYQIPSAPLANGKYRITSRLSSQKDIVVAGASMATSAKVIQYGYSSATPTNDEWNLTRIGTTGYYKITNANSGLAMAVEGASYNNSADVIQHNYTDDTVDNDEWFIVSVGSGYYMIVNRRSNKVLNVEGAVLTDNAQIIQYDYSNAAQNQWQFTSIP